MTERKKLDADDRRFLLTAAWLFARHGQPARARAVCEALVEANPRDGVSAAALAEMLLDDGEPQRALEVVRASRFPRQLARAEAVLETRALRATGRSADADRRWKRYVESAKGRDRTWVK